MDLHTKPANVTVRAAEELTRLNERLGRLAAENLAFSRENAQLRALRETLEGETLRLGERCVAAEQVLTLATAQCLCPVHDPAPLKTPGDS